MARAGNELVGRVVDGLGRPLDGGLPIEGRLVPVDRDPPRALGRSTRRSRRPLPRGCAACSTRSSPLAKASAWVCSPGRGSARAPCLARSRAAPTRRSRSSMSAIVGEQGREVGEFLDRSLSADARKKRASSSQPRAMSRGARASSAPRNWPRRMRSTSATRGRASSCSSTRSRALLAPRARSDSRPASPPVRRGYPPSVFCGAAASARAFGPIGTRCGSITAIYTVLVEGGDMDEPIADEGSRHPRRTRGARSTQSAARGRYPAVDVAAVPIARVMDTIATPAHRDAARRLRGLVASYEAKRDLVILGRVLEGKRPGTRRSHRADAARRGFLGARHERAVALRWHGPRAGQRRSLVPRITRT